MSTPLHIFSMTGFAKRQFSVGDESYTLEIRTLNSKNMEIHCRFPSALKALEMDVRKAAGKSLHRGKADVSLTVSGGASTRNSEIDKEAISAYQKSLSGITAEEPTLQVLMHLPGVFKEKSTEITEGVEEAIQHESNLLLEDCMAYRKEEGIQLGMAILSDKAHILKHLEYAKQYEKQRKDLLKQSLLERYEEFAEGKNLDEQRFHQELFYYLEKYDTNEEFVRLEMHCNLLEEVMHSPVDSKGKKLGFICQEIGREINTIGSKCNLAEMQNAVVEMKDALERMKEQLLNIL